MEKVQYSGWENCYKLKNKFMELIVTSDIGPRIIRCGYINDKNLFYENSKEMGRVGDDYWLSYGGHRLWHAPEDPIRTYYPDNHPVKIESIDDGLQITQNIEETTGIQKFIKLRIDNQAVIIEQVLKNCGLWPLKLAAWGITVMRPGGYAILPLPERGPHPQNLNPTSSLILWPYTDLSDERFKFHYRYIEVIQDSNTYTPQKLGLLSHNGWLAYLNENTLFIKYSPKQSEMTYPDLGSNLEVYVDHKILELETLSPLVEILPGKSISHKEVWILKKMAPDQLEPEAIFEVVSELVSTLITEL